MHECKEEGWLPKPMTANAYEHARRLTAREVLPELSGFRIDTEEKRDIWIFLRTDGLAAGRGQDCV